MDINGVIDHDLTNVHESVVKYKNYDEHTLKVALSECENQSIYSVAQKHGIPKQTLAWHLKKLKTGESLKKSGPDNVLTAEEEDRIVKWILDCSALGFPKTIQDLKFAAAKIRKTRNPLSTPQFKNDTPSSYWIKSFLKRHPSITFRTPEALSRAAANVSVDRIRRFFNSFYEYLEKSNQLDVLNRPDAFYNLDETNFELNPRPRRVLARKGAKTVYNVDSSKPKENISVCYCFGANGSTLRTQVILKTAFSRMQDLSYAAGSVSGHFLFTQTTNGWQTKQSFLFYLKRLDEELKDVERPIFFFFDNHPSHLDFELFEWARSRKIHLVSFPPNCTHILQMCDTSIFGPAKQGWKREVNNWKRENGNKELDEIEFIKILKRMSDNVITKDKIINGFRGTGLFPFNFDNVHIERCIGASENEDQAGEFSNQDTLHDEQNMELIPPKIRIISVETFGRAQDTRTIQHPEGNRTKAIPELLTEMQKYANQLHELIVEDDKKDYKLNSLIVKQQLNILSSVYNHQSSLPFTINDQSASNTTQAHSSSFTPTSSTFTPNSTSFDQTHSSSFTLDHNQAHSSTFIPNSSAFTPNSSSFNQTHSSSFTLDHNQAHSSTFRPNSSAFTPNSSTFTPNSSSFTPTSSTFISDSNQAHSSSFTLDHNQARLSTFTPNLLTCTPNSSTFTPNSSTFTPNPSTFTPNSTSFDQTHSSSFTLDHNQAHSSNFRPNSSAFTPNSSTFTPNSSSFTPNSNENTPQTINEILNIPEPYKRKTNQRYKKINFGILTSEEILDMYKKDMEAKDEEKREKERKKIIREEKKLIREKAKIIKKEKVEGKIDPSDGTEKRKRGRPKKQI